MSRNAVRPKRMPGAVCCALATLALAWSLAGSAAGIVIPAGGELRAGNGQIAVDCIDLTVAGVLDVDAARIGRIGDVQIASTGSLFGGTSSLQVGGNWQADGRFEPEAGTVAFVDGCRSEVSIAGTDRFTNVIFSSTTGKVFALSAGSTIQVTGQLTIAGSDSQPLRIVSSDLSQPVTIGLGPTATVAVTNANPPAGAVIIGPGSGGGFSVPQVIPSTSIGSLLMLVAAVAGVAWRRRSANSGVSV